jgi:hypothetical protein
MAEPEPQSGEDAHARPKRRRLWRRFVVGFLVVFVGMSLFPILFYDGRTARQTMVWHYYVLEIQQKNEFNRRYWANERQLECGSYNGGATFCNLRRGGDN